MEIPTPAEENARAIFADAKPPDPSGRIVKCPKVGKIGRG